MSIIKRISYHHEGGRSSSITFSTNGRIESIITRHTVFDNIARFETAERIKAEIEKRATIDGGNVTVETFFGEVYDNARAADDEQYYNERNQ